MPQQNPRKGSYGYLVRVNCGVNLNNFTTITVAGSASSNVSAMSFDTGGGTAFVGNSTVYSSVDGRTFNSGEWVWFRNGTNDAFVTADTYTFTVHASATGQYFKSQGVLVSVDA